jgi:hypothetical protein
MRAEQPPHTNSRRYTMFGYDEDEKFRAVETDELDAETLALLAQFEDELDEEF